MILVLVVLILDQSLKVWVKTTMFYQQDIPLIGEWARLHFVENNGMAFGLSLAGSYGKLALSLFRIVAVLFLIYYIKVLADSKAAFGLLASFALILAGALGNIIDSAFYGMIFSPSYPGHGGIATMFPPEGGYSSFLHGKVVDMLYFPMIKGNFPDWMPVWGGENFLFFRPVFNIADMSITTGVLSIIIFHRDFFNNVPEPTAPAPNAATINPAAAETPVVDEERTTANNETELREEQTTEEVEEDLAEIPSEGEKEQKDIS